MISVEQWMGKKLAIVPEQPLAETNWIRNVKMSDQLPDEESVHKEKYRPQFHVAPSPLRVLAHGHRVSSERTFLQALLERGV